MHAATHADEDRQALGYHAAELTLPPPPPPAYAVYAQPVLVLRQTAVYLLHNRKTSEVRKYYP
ncbi:hypothetical protein BH23BAC4_BH23BAC4_15530 [soil metagenome]